jgi:hypothetical protein
MPRNFAAQPEIASLVAGFRATSISINIDVLPSGGEFVISTIVDI